MKIYVLMQGKPLGVLEEETEQISYRYFDNINKNNYLPSLEETEYSSNELPTVFEALLPEDESVDIIRVQNSLSYKIEILLYLDGIHGSFQFLSEMDFKSFSESCGAEVVFSRDKEKILDNRYSFPNILELKIAISKNILFPNNPNTERVIGLSGFQNKFGVFIDYEKKEISKDDFSNYFMKPYTKEYTEFTRNKDRVYAPYLSINEHLFMTIARDLGFDAPWSAIIKDGKDYHYIIKRYDRHLESKLDHFDTATLLGLKSGNKYDATFEKIFSKLAAKLESDDLFKALSFIFYSALISHGDLHSKNISIIRDSNILDSPIKYHLAPLYDISTTSIYKGLNTRDLGMKLHGKLHEIRIEHFLEFGQNIGLDQKKLTDEFLRIATYFEKNFLSYIEALPADIKVSNFKITIYHNKTLAEILEKFYRERMLYINKYVYQKQIDNRSVF